MKALVCSLLALSMLLGAWTPSRAAVNVERSGSENPMVEVARSTLYGGLTGLLLGGALAIASDGKHDASMVRWGFVGGTFFGFGFGLWHVTARPRANALLEIENGGLRMQPPTLVLLPERGANGRDVLGTRVALVGARF